MDTQWFLEMSLALENFAQNCCNHSFKVVKKELRMKKLPFEPIYLIMIALLLTLKTTLAYLWLSKKILD